MIAVAESPAPTIQWMQAFPVFTEPLVIRGGREILTILVEVKISREADKMQAVFDPFAALGIRGGFFGGSFYLVNRYFVAEFEGFVNQLSN